MKKQPKFYKPEPIILNPAILHYGQQNPYTGKETDFQKSSAALVAFHGLAFAYHVPNESRRPGKAGNIERMMLKAQGVLSGVADWCIPYKTSYGHPGAYIELKAKGGKLSQDQIKFLNAAFEQGYFCAVAWNLDSFEALLKELYPKKRFVKPDVMSDGYPIPPDQVCPNCLKDTFAKAQNYNGSPSMIYQYANCLHCLAELESTWSVVGFRWIMRQQNRLSEFIGCMKDAPGTFENDLKMLSE